MAIASQSTTLRAPSLIRWVIVGLMLIVSMVTYLDRINISIASSQIMSTYGLSPVDMGKIFSAFVFSYGLFQLAGGWLADRFGPRAVLSFAILWWSAFTALTACIADIVPISIAPTIVTLIVARFCLGIGEAAAWPSFNRTNATWIPPNERALASSIPLAGGGLGAALTSPFIAWLMISYGWKTSFYICGAIGTVVAAVWFWYVRDRPSDHPGVNAAELLLIEGARPSLSPGKTVAAPKTPWGRIFTETNVYLIFLTNFSAGYVIYIYLTWFYTYLLQARHLSVMKGSVYTMGPFLAITLMTPLGGLLCDRAAKRYGRTFGRRVIAISGMGVAAISLFLGARLPNLNESIFAFSLGAGAVYFSLSAHWATTIDITREHAGTVSGIMNWGGNTGGMISPILMPYLAQKFGWMPALEIAAGILLAGSLLWLFIQPEKLLDANFAEREIP
jgi:MFS transporter, ACS family, glucarate transporter